MPEIDISNIVLYATSSYLAYLGGTGFHLVRTALPKDKRKVKIYTRIRNTNPNQEIAIQQVEAYNQSLKLFLERVKGNPRFNPTFLLNNLQDVKVKNSFLSNFLLGASASYNTLTNNIKVNPQKYSLSIYHELFHLASTFKDKDKIYSGFSQLQITTLSKIGQGMNEGYTELLHKRYFPHASSDTAYQILVFFMKSLEEIIDQEKMEKLYSEANLKGLIAELETLMNQEEIMAFIRDMDVLLTFDFFKKIMAKKVVNVCRFLLKCYAAKERQKVDKGLISWEDYQSYVSWYTSKLLSAEFKYENKDLLDGNMKSILANEAFTLTERTCQFEP